jgi:hypothetical protein
LSVLVLRLKLSFLFYSSDFAFTPALSQRGLRRGHGKERLEEKEFIVQTGQSPQPTRSER